MCEAADKLQMRFCNTQEMRHLKWQNVGNTCFILMDASEQRNHQQCNYYLTSDKDQSHMWYKAKLCIVNKI